MTIETIEDYLALDEREQRLAISRAFEKHEKWKRWRDKNVPPPQNIVRIVRVTKNDRRICVPEL